jgi:hypothetical protein
MLCGQNNKILNVKPGGTFNNHGLTLFLDKFLNCQIYKNYYMSVSNLIFFPLYDIIILY